MKALKCFFAAALVLALCLGLLPGAFAESGEKIPYGELEWDELMDRLLTDYRIKPEFVAAGYLNLETGEEHYLNGDDYMLTGSMYKVPLCMYFTEHLAAGDIDWSIYESHFTFEEKRDSVLINSSNEDAIFLTNMIGGYTEFRRLTADYMGVDPDEELRNINNFENWYSAREFIHCLALLYNEQERFPGIIETMQKATPDRFFKLNEPRFKIAHKYGEYKDPNGGPSCLNDCGLAFTKQPIAMVLFTRGQNNAEEFISDFATAMCEYTEARAAAAAATPEPSPGRDRGGKHRASDLSSAPRRLCGTVPVAGADRHPGALRKAQAALLLAVPCPGGLCRRHAAGRGGNAVGHALRQAQRRSAGRGPRLL